MRRPLTGLVAVVAALGLTFVLVGCSRPSDSASDHEPATCARVLQGVVSQMRADATTGVDQGLQWLTEHCDSEYDVATDYAAVRASTQGTGPETCAFLSERRISTAAIALLRDDGLCTEVEDAAETDPVGGISWNQAAAHVGTVQRVCGPLAGDGISDDDVFLDLGLDYPDPGRFQIVLWDVGGVEPIAVGSTLCASGTITSYKGVPQIELDDPALVEILD